MKKYTALEAAHEMELIRQELETLGPAPDVLPFVVGDVTSEALEAHARANAGCFSLADDEGACIENFLGRHSHGQASVNVINKAWSGGVLNSSRVGRGVTSVPKVLGSVALTVQPAVLADVLGHTGAVDRGFLARFLVVRPSYVVADSWAPPPISGWLRDEYDMAIGNILRLCHPGRVVPAGKDEARAEEGEVAVVRLNPQAARLAQEFYEAHAPSEDDGSHGWRGKARGMVYRIALALHLLADATGQEIEADTMRAAIAWYPYLEAHFMHACQEASLPPEAKAAERLLQSIQRKPPQGAAESGRDLFQRVRGDSVPDRAAFDRVLALLADAGWLRKAKDTGTGQQGGRPRENWFIHPSLLRSVA
ncbi:MAG: DUF3987 domain-containing protein [Planctomycetota bacterium]|nr:MAG: DUF3987 domain-containing protein [Planctomycetota bacterium]